MFQTVRVIVTVVCSHEACVIKIIMSHKQMTPKLYTALLLKIHELKTESSLKTHRHRATTVALTVHTCKSSVKKVFNTHPDAVEFM